MAKFIQVKQANPAKMGKTAHMCLMNTRLAFGISKGTFASAKRDMQSQKNSGTLHSFDTIPQDLAVPLYSYANLINGHVGLWYKGVYYSDGVKKSLPPRWAIAGWGELCDGVRIVKLSTAGATTGFLPAKGYWKRGDQDQRIAILAEFLRTAFPAYTSKKALGNIFGPYIEQSVREFQRRTGLKVDGIVGKDTYTKLKQYGFTA